MRLQYYLSLITCVLSYPLNSLNNLDPYLDIVKPGVPAGGVSPLPEYKPQSDFDYQSLLVGINQEYMELDLFNFGLAKFSDEEFEEAGLTAPDRELIHFMALQEIGHAELIAHILGESAPHRCNYTWPFETVSEFVSFTQRLTRWGESGVYGFLSHLDSRPVASLLIESITTEARQQFSFRQFQGLSPQPYDFITGVPQSFAWTLMAPYITSCPATNPKVEFPNFPALVIRNQPVSHSPPALATINNTLTVPGRKVEFWWEDPGLPVGWVEVEDAPNINYTNAGLYNGSTTGEFNGSTLISDDLEDQVYNTTTYTHNPPKYAAWISQLNTTYTELHDIDGNTGWTYQPKTTVFPDSNNTIVNGTVFVVLTDKKVPLTPFNISKINEHVVAGPALYQAD